MSESQKRTLFRALRLTSSVTVSIRPVTSTSFRAANSPSCSSMALTMRLTKGAGSSLS